MDDRCNDTLTGAPADSVAHLEFLARFLWGRVVPASGPHASTLILGTGFLVHPQIFKHKLIHEIGYN